MDYEKSAGTFLRSLVEPMQEDVLGVDGSWTWIPENGITAIDIKQMTPATGGEGSEERDETNSIML